MITIQWEYIPLIMMVICILLMGLSGEGNFVNIIPAIIFMICFMLYIVMGILWLIKHINIV